MAVRLSCAGSNHPVIGARTIVCVIRLPPPGEVMALP
jgi:hypothetical protein